MKQVDALSGRVGFSFYTPCNIAGLDGWVQVFLFRFWGAYTITIPGRYMPILGLDSEDGLFSVIFMVEVTFVCMLSHQYPYEKAIVLNALYDALDAIGVNILQAISREGVFLVRWQMDVQLELQVVAISVLACRHTQIGISFANQSMQSKGLAQVLLDEIGAVLMKAGVEETKCT